MRKGSKVNLHVPLPEDLGVELRAEARKTGRPVTELAREGIRMLLETRRRRLLHQEIAAYASKVSGTPDDLDPDLEPAAARHLLRRGGSDS